MTNPVEIFNKESFLVTCHQQKNGKYEGYFPPQKNSTSSAYFSILNIERSQEIIKKNDVEIGLNLSEKSNFIFELKKAEILTSKKELGKKNIFFSLLF